MGFRERSFTQPIYSEESVEAKKAIIISCEGSVTEPEYFKSIKNNLATYISAVIEIRIAEKNGERCEPKDILKNLEQHIETYDCKEGYDELWIVLDREIAENTARKTKIIEIMPECKSKNYNIAITNPAFEFWLLLHIADIKTYDKTTLHANEKVSTRKRYLEKELSTHLGGYGKKREKFQTKITTKENIQRALEQEKLFENEFEKILDNLGSNVGVLIQKIVQFD